MARGSEPPLTTADFRALELGASLSDLTENDLLAALTGDPAALDVHLTLVERDLEIDGHQVKVHCHCLAIDGNGRAEPHRLAEFLRNAIADYAIPRSKLAAAKERDAKYNSTAAVAGLLEQARRSFTDLAKTGEGGEMLLFVLAERFLKMPQILCKMDLKTSPKMHYHGADGVYAVVTTDGTLKLYWGESKIYKNVEQAIEDCLASLAPFLVEPDHEGAKRERDLILLSDKADLSNPALTQALKLYFDSDSIQSKRVKYCGVALVGFDATIYPTDNATAVASFVSDGAKQALQGWKDSVGKHLKLNKLESFEVELFCLPLPSAEQFRSAFLKSMGLA